MKSLNERLAERQNTPSIEPIPLEPDRTPPPFPIDVLPAWMRAQVQQVADELQVPVDMPAQLSITALSIGAARRWHIHIQASWYETLNTYLVTAMDPTAGKSPSVKRILGPVKEYEAELIEATTIQREDRELVRKMISKEIDKALNAGEAAEMLAKRDELRANPEITVARLIADDVTPEKLGMLMSDQGGRMAIVSTEGDLFNMMAGKYKDTSDLALYLKAWSADDHVVDRVGRDSVLLVAAHLTVGITVQPAVLRRVAANTEMRELGLAARFMYSVPTDNVGYRDLARQSTWSQDVETSYRTQLDRYIRHHYQREEMGTLRLSDAALELFTTFRTDMEVRRRPGAELHSLRAWSGKMESSVVRLAGLLHLADGHDERDDIDASTMARAMTVGFYWIGHAKLVEDLFDVDPDVVRAKVILDWIRSENLSDFSVRDVYRANRSTFPTAAETVEPLQLLTDRLWITPQFDGEIEVGRRGVESPRFAVMQHVRNNHVPHGPCPQNTNLELPTYLTEFVLGARDKGHDGHDGQLEDIHSPSDTDLEPF